MIKKIKAAIKNPSKILIRIFRFKVFSIIPDGLFLKIMYRLYIGKKLNLEDPKTFCEKLQWLKLNDRKSEYSIYVDKYAVRSYIAKTIGEEYLIPMIAVYDNVDDIQWEYLPNRFVLKCTHGSNSNIICTDKNQLNINDSRNKLKKWLKQNWFWYGREWPYKNVKPGIICEEFISNNNEPPEDYKVMCFNGKAKFIQVHLHRFSSNYVCDNYDTKWNKMTLSKKKCGLPNSNLMIPKPAFLEQMICLSEHLSRDMYHTRIDWYIVGDKLYFGEITFYSGSGFSQYDNVADNLLLGSWISI